MTNRGSSFCGLSWYSTLVERRASTGSQTLRTRRSMCPLLSSLLSMLSVSGSRAVWASTWTRHIGTSPSARTQSSPKKPVTLVVEDAKEDERFMHSALVLGPPYIRFYAGAPLCYTDLNGQEWKLGTLCVIDSKPRKITEDQIAMLEMLARLVVTELELRMKFKTRVKEVKDSADQHAVLRAAEMHTAYIGQVAHDLRTPLNSFNLGLEALRSLDDATPEMVAIIDTMKVSLELMDITCTKAIDHSKFEAGRDLAAKHAPFLLSDVLKKSQIVVAGYTHESRGVTYEYKIDEGVVDSVITDKEWFWHILMNFLSNARKFTTEVANPATPQSWSTAEILAARK
mmetsp:Transcript_38359/g.89328  ORF Transcript_38359/g.89328 Transcript_38359/m.89328 type:complete len:342 (-) Transcript_38359:1121-2146(-)